MPTMAQTSAMPLSFRFTLSAFSEEKATAVPSKARPLPSSRRSLSFAVTMAIFAPAFWKASKMVGARSHFGSFIIVSWPVAGSMR